MKLTTLGTGTASPSATRTAPCHAIQADDALVLIDLGAGAMHRLATHEIDWHGADAVLISHFHIDHVGELPAYIMALRYGTYSMRSRPLSIVGPPGARKLLENLASAHGEWVANPEFRIDVVEIEPGELWQMGSLEVDCFPTPHTDESIAFKLSESGKSLVYTGDTGPGDHLSGWANGCDALLAECSLPEDRAIAIHLTPRQAGSMARSASAGRLILTHFYPPMGASEAVEQAREVYDGPVTAAQDGDSFEIGSQA